MNSRYPQPRGFEALREVLDHLLHATTFNRSRAMVAVDFRTLGRQGFVNYKYTKNGPSLSFAVKRTRDGRLAVHNMPVNPQWAYIGASLVRGLAGNNRYVPPEYAQPLRTFATVQGAINFMSAQGRAYPTLIRSVRTGLPWHTYSNRNNAARGNGNRQHVAAIAWQSAFRGLKARRNLHKPPSPEHPEGGAAFQKAMRNFNALRFGNTQPKQPNKPKQPNRLVPLSRSTMEKFNRMSRSQKLNYLAALSHHVKHYAKP